MTVNTRKPNYRTVFDVVVAPYFG